MIICSRFVGLNRLLAGGASPSPTVLSAHQFVAVGKIVNDFVVVGEGLGPPALHWFQMFATAAPRHRPTICISPINRNLSVKKGTDSPLQLYTNTTKEISLVVFVSLGTYERLPPGGSWRRKATEGERVIMRSI